MAKKKTSFVAKVTRNKYSSNEVCLQFSNGARIGYFCYSAWRRQTSIVLNSGESTRVRLSFEKIKD